MDKPQDERRVGLVLWAAQLLVDLGYSRIRMIRVSHKRKWNQLMAVVHGPHWREQFRAWGIGDDSDSGVSGMDMFSNYYDEDDFDWVYSDEEEEQ
jgi:hypothetical protein